MLLRWIIHMIQVLNEINDLMYTNKLMSLSIGVKRFN